MDCNKPKKQTRPLMKKPFSNLLALSASLGWLSLSAGPVLQAQCLPFGFEAKLPFPGANGQQAQYGTAVAVDGYTLVVGARNAGANQEGAAYVQTLGGGGPTLLDHTPEMGYVSRDFGDHVAISSDFIVVADSLESNDPESPANAPAGAIYVYGRDDLGSTPRRLASTSANASTSRFGSGLAIEGTNLLVGAEGENKVYVYEFRSANGITFNWQLVQEVPEEESSLTGKFGRSVAISGNTIAVGAPETSTGSLTDNGAVYIFERVNGIWSQTAVILGTLGQEEFGYSVALEGDTLVVGAPAPFSPKGAAYVFTRGSGWGQPAKLQGASWPFTDNFGYSVALRGSYLLIGSPRLDFQGEYARGVVAVFQRPFGSATTWTSLQTIETVDSLERAFGTSVALGASFAVGGAPLTDGGAGAAYVYSFPLVLADEKVTVHYHDHDAPGATTESSGYSKADIRGDIGFAVPEVAPTPQAHVMAWLGSQLIASTPVVFDVGGNNGDKWEAKPASGPVEKFKIHWYEAVEFDAVQSNPASPKIKSKFIGLTETELRYEAKAGTYQTTFPAHGVTVNVVSGKITAISGATASEIESDKKAADLTLGSRLVPGQQIITTGGITDTITVTAGVNYQSAQGKFELKLRQDAAFVQPLFTAGTSLRYEIVLGTDMGACAAGGASVIGVEPKRWDADDNNHKRYHEDSSD
jgi:hypothetical protein